MSETLDRSRMLARYAESRNGILAHRIRAMPQEDFDLLYADGTHQPPPLISFAELEAPLTGWRLDTVTRVPSARGLSYDVAVIREADGHRIGVMSTSLDLAFVDARAEAIVHEQRHPASRGGAPMTDLPGVGLVPEMNRPALEKHHDQE